MSSLHDRLIWVGVESVEDSQAEGMEVDHREDEAPTVEDEASSQPEGVQLSENIPEPPEPPQPTSGEAWQGHEASTVRTGWGNGGWLSQISKHLSHIEERSMWAEVLGHELLRQFMMILEGFSPPPRGDWGWLLRKSEDLSTRGLRQLMRFYRQPGDDIAEFLEDGMSLVRLYMEEAFHRVLLSTDEPLRKRAICSLMCTMRSFETHMIPAQQASLGVFFTFTEENVRAMALRISQQPEDTSIEICPSFPRVMSSCMQIEVLSLMQVKPEEGAIHISNEEVRALLDYHGHRLRETEVVPGASSSRFEDLFVPEVPPVLPVQPEA